MSIEAWIEPGYQPPIPVIEPREPHVPEKVIFFPFTKKIRDWHVRAQEGKDQTLVYDEQRGWHIAGDTESLEVDHLYPESGLIEEGRTDPNASPAIVRAKSRHTGDGRVYTEDEIRLAGYGEPEWSRHPDVADALDAYRNGDKDAFRRLGAAHQQAAKNGQSITNDDWGTVEAERERMEALEWKYQLEHPEDQKPQAKTHPKFKKKHWTDVFGSNGNS